MTEPLKIGDRVTPYQPGTIVSITHDGEFVDLEVDGYGWVSWKQKYLRRLPPDDWMERVAAAIIDKSQDGDICGYYGPPDQKEIAAIIRQNFEGSTT